MLFNFCIVIIALVFPCGAEIEIPELQNIIRCKSDDSSCININKDKLTKALSRPLPQYSTRGYDPLVLAPFTIYRPGYRLAQTYNYLEVIGLGDTKILSATMEVENGVKLIREVYEHNLRISGSARFDFYVLPFKVSHEGPFSEEIFGLRSTFTFPYKQYKKNNKTHLNVGKERLVGVDMLYLPNINAEQQVPFVSDPAIKNIFRKIVNHPYEYHKPLYEQIIEVFGPRYFQDKNKFYNNVTLSMFLNDLGD